MTMNQNCLGPFYYYYYYYYYYSSDSTSEDDGRKEERSALMMTIKTANVHRVTSFMSIWGGSLQFAVCVCADNTMHDGEDEEPDQVDWCDDDDNFFAH